MPRGFANEINDLETDDAVCAETDDNADGAGTSTLDAVANAVSRAKISTEWICSWCGGRGHATNVEGTECLLNV